MREFLLLSILLALLPTQGWTAPPYRTERIVLVVIDGVRYSESLGDSTRSVMPHLWNELAPAGTINHCFFNDGETETFAGHAALLTGVYRDYPNWALNFFGLRIHRPRPEDPTLFEYFRKATGAPRDALWVVASKFKLGNFDHSSHEEYGEEFGGEQAAGKGFTLPGTGNRWDESTWEKVLEVIADHSPRILVINLADPDRRAHDGDWEGYLEAIRENDGRIASLWGFLQRDPTYQGKTALIVTADHGRHPDTVDGGFREHGDECPGCRHILLAALGPDFQEGVELHQYRTQIDLVPTLGEILGFPTPYARGQVMWELLRPELVPTTAPPPPTTILSELPPWCYLAEAPSR